MQKVLLSICFLFLGILFTLHFLRPITAINEDLGRHLLLGNIILQTHQVPLTNLLSYTHPDFPFINSHWGSEVVFSLIYNHFGFNGLLFFTTLLAWITIGIIVLFIYKKYTPLLFIVTSFLYLQLLFERTDIRPESFSLFFFAFFIVILYQFRSRYTKLIFLLIPLEMLWVNFHIYFFVGIIVQLLFLLDQFILSKGTFTKSVKTLSLILFLSIVATLFNPNMLSGALFPLTVFHNYSFPVVENQNIFTLLTIYNHPSVYYFIIVVVILFLSFFLRRKTIQPITLLLGIFFSIATIVMFRTISLFVIATFIPFLEVTTPLVQTISHRLRPHVAPLHRIILKNYFLCIVALVLLAQIGYTLSHQSVGFGVIERGKESINFYKEQPLTGPIYNNFDMGSYLSYRLYPEKIFVDGRPEAYPKEFFTDVYFPLQENKKVFNQTAEKYHFSTLIISHWDQTPWKNTFFRELLRHESFTLIYLDDYAIILVRNTESNKSLREKFAISETSFRLPKTDDAETLIRYLYFFEKVGWAKQEEEVLKKLSVIDSEQMLKKYKNAITH